MVDLLLPVLCAGIALAEAWIRFGAAEPDRGMPAAKEVRRRAFMID